MSAKVRLEVRPRLGKARYDGVSRFVKIHDALRQEKNMGARNCLILHANSSMQSQHPNLSPRRRATTRRNLIIFLR